MRRPAFTGRDLLQNVTLSVASTLFILLLLEMFLRVTRAVPVHSLEYTTQRMWRQIPGPLLPGQSFTDRFKSRLPYRISVNQLGLRGAEFSRGKQPGTLRILCLGDSYTYGTYVDDSRTWPAALQQILREEHPEIEVEVINAGISGFTIIDELAFMKEHGLALEPDITILAFCLNDLADLTRKVSTREMLRRSSEEAAASLLTPMKAVLRRTAIYNMLFLMKARVLVTLGSPPTAHQIGLYHTLKKFYGPEDLELFARYKEHLAEMKDLLDRQGVRLFFVIFPLWEQIGRGATGEPQRWMTGIAEDLGVMSVDLLPAFLRHDPYGRKYFLVPVDTHPSARGYRRAAREMAAALAPFITRESHPPRLSADSSP